MAPELQRSHRAPCVIRPSFGQVICPITWTPFTTSPRSLSAVLADDSFIITDEPTNTWRLCTAENRLRLNIIRNTGNRALNIFPFLIRSKSRVTEASARGITFSVSCAYIRVSDFVCVWGCWADDWCVVEEHWFVLTSWSYHNQRVHAFHLLSLLRFCHRCCDEVDRDDDDRSSVLVVALMSEIGSVLKNVGLILIW